jgi:hemolysin III
MSCSPGLPRYRAGEETANGVSHGIGMVLAVAALAILTVYASALGSTRHLVGCTIFGVTLIFLYTASTLYH